MHVKALPVIETILKSKAERLTGGSGDDPLPSIFLSRYSGVLSI